MSKANDVDTEESEYKKWTGRTCAGARAGEFMQTRFKRIPDAHLNAETVAGVRDMNLGRIKQGKPVGAPTIRFDTGANSGADPHINIDPKGFSSAKNPHIEVSEGVVEGAKIVGKTLKYAGIALTVAAVAVDTWRVVSAFKDDLYIRDHANEIIDELEGALNKLNKALEAETKPEKKSAIRKTIEHLENVLKDVKRTKKVPTKTIKTISSVGGGWSAGLAGGWGGAWVGTQTGAMVGSVFGPVGTVVGAPIGAVVGAVGAGIAAGMAGSAVAEYAAEEGLEYFVET